MPPLEDENLLKKAEEEAAQKAQQQQQGGPAQDQPAGDPPPQAPAQNAPTNEWSDEVPRDKDGKRPSDNTLNFDELPPDIRDKWANRFGSLYKQVKAQDRHLDQMGRDFGQRLENLSQKNEAKDRELGDIRTAVERLSSKDADDAERLKEEGLRRELAKAKEEMNFTREAEIQDELLEIKAERRFRKVQGERKADGPPQPAQPAAQPVPEPAAPQPQAGGLTASQLYQLEEWAVERDPAGNFIRPWAADTRHPLNQFAKNQMVAIFSHPNAQRVDFQQLLQAADQQIGVAAGQRPAKERQSATPPPAPLQANRDHRTAPAKDEVRLTPEQKTTAHRMFSHLSPADAEKKYLAGYKATLGV